jgi:hypothetical protein
MGNTLCKPVVQVQEQIVEQPKIIEPLLTEESIKILNVENETKPVISETKETETIKEAENVVEPLPVETILEPVISETKEPVLEPEPIKETGTVEPVLEPEVEQLSIVQPDEASSTSSKEEEEVPPLKKKRGRKKKGEQ